MTWKPNSRAWTAEENRLFDELVAQKKTYREIGIILGRSRDSCAGHARGDQSKADKDHRIYETDRQAEMRIKLYGEEIYR